MEFIKDTIYINKTVLSKTCKLLSKNWTVIFTGLIYFAITLIGYILLGPFFSVPVMNILASIALYLLSLSLISSYFYILYNIIRGGKFELNDIKRGYTVYLNELMRIFFIGWIAEIIVMRLLVPVIASSLGGALDEFSIIMIINLIVFIAINPLPEVIYQKHYSGLDAIRYTFDYMKENWIEWLIPSIIFFGLIYLTTGKAITNLFNINIGMDINVGSLKDVALYLLGQVIFSFAMIYRGVLFDLLSTSSRRKRMFMRNVYK